MSQQSSLYPPPDTARIEGRPETIFVYLRVEALHKRCPQDDICRACAAWHYTVEVYGAGATDKEGVAARKFYAGEG